MTKFATFTDSLPTGFYDPAIHGDAIPSDAVEITDAQWQEFLAHPHLRKWDGSKVVVYDPPAPVPTKTDVDREREHRIVAGKTFTIAGAGDIPVTGRPEDQVTLLALKDTARGLKAAGVTDAIIPYRDGANTDHLLTADQVISLTDQGKAYVTKLYQASWTLKAMDPIPADFADDSHWPATT